MGTVWGRIPGRPDSIYVHFHIDWTACPRDRWDISTGQTGERRPRCSPEVGVSRWIFYVYWFSFPNFWFKWKLKHGLLRHMNFDARAFEVAFQWKEGGGWRWAPPFIAPADPSSAFSTTIVNCYAAIFLLRPSFLLCLGPFLDRNNDCKTQENGIGTGRDAIAIHCTW